HRLAALPEREAEEVGRCTLPTFFIDSPHSWGSTLLKFGGHIVPFFREFFGFQKQPSSNPNEPLGASVNSTSHSVVNASNPSSSVSGEVAQGVKIKYAKGQKIVYFPPVRFSESQILLIEEIAEGWDSDVFIIGEGDLEIDDDVDPTGRTGNRVGELT